MRGRQVGVPGAREEQRLVVGRPDGDLLGPAVLDQQRERRPGRAAEAHPADELGVVALDRHPGAAPVAELAARQLRVDVRRPEDEPRGHPLENRQQRGPVRLARRVVSPDHRALPPLKPERKCTRPSGVHFRRHALRERPAPTS